MYPKSALTSLLIKDNIFLEVKQSRSNSKSHYNNYNDVSHICLSIQLQHYFHTQRVHKKSRIQALHFKAIYQCVVDFQTFLTVYSVPVPLLIHLLSYQQL